MDRIGGRGTHQALSMPRAPILSRWLFPLVHNNELVSGDRILALITCKDTVVQEKTSGVRLPTNVPNGARGGGDFAG
jgi:hypothetical protein